MELHSASCLLINQPWLSKLFHKLTEMQRTRCWSTQRQETLTGKQKNRIVFVLWLCLLTLCNFFPAPFQRFQPKPCLNDKRPTPPLASFSSSIVVLWRTVDVLSVVLLPRFCSFLPFSSLWLSCTS